MEFIICQLADDRVFIISLQFYLRIPNALAAFVIFSIEISTCSFV
jgi:hypothetical protein